MQKRENRAEELYEVIMAKSFSKLSMTIKQQIQEAQRTPRYIANKPHLGISY